MAIRFYKLQNLLRTRKITNKEIQCMTGFSSATMAKFFAKDKESKVSLSTVNKVCKFLECDVSDIMEYEKDK